MARARSYTTTFRAEQGMSVNSSLESAKCETACLDCLLTFDAHDTMNRGFGYCWLDIQSLSIPKISSGLEIVAVREIISHSAPSSDSSFFQWFASHLWSSSQLSFCSSGV